jgi:hypothetical protein
VNEIREGAGYGRLSVDYSDEIIDVAMALIHHDRFGPLSVRHLPTGLTIEAMICSTD